MARRSSARSRRARRLATAVLASAAGCGDDPPDSGSAPASHDPTARFVARREGSGIDFVHDAGGSGRKYFPEINAGGISLFDHDGDGDLDVWFAQGAPLPGREVTPQPPPLIDRLYRNDGGFRFTDVTAATGAGEDGYSFSGACPDIDGDGDLDLFISNLGPDRLLVNDGAGRFSDVTEASGLSSALWSSCAGFADFDRDGDLDVYIGNYLVYDLEKPKPCGDTERGAEYLAYCHPDVFPGARDVLYRNDGGRDGGIRFTDVTAAAGVAESHGKTLAVVPADIDDDGDVDLYVATDHVPNLLWRNDAPAGGALQFTEVAFDLGLAQDGNGNSESCMGSDVVDVDQDGDLDVFSANMAKETNTLWINEGKLFVDDTDFAGLGRDSYPYVGFGAKFFDQDLDGDLDLAVANGHVLDNIALYTPHESFAQPPHFYENYGRAKFRLLGAAAGAYFGEQHVGRAIAAGDLDDDGDVDLVFAHWNAAPELLENRAAQSVPAPGWIGLDLRGKGANRRALGARVQCIAGELRQVAEVRGEGSYAAWNDTRLIFGLGARTAVDAIKIRWPDGSRQSLEGLAPGRYHRITQP